MGKVLVYLFIIFFLLIFFYQTNIVIAAEQLPSAVLVDGRAATLNEVIANAAKLVLGLVGVLALIMFIIGGVSWMTSAGNAEQVKKGKGTLIWATIGLVVCFLAYSLVTFFITRFIGFSPAGTVTGGMESCSSFGGTCIPTSSCEIDCSPANGKTCTRNPCSSTGQSCCINMD